jgi:hypothetical protein
VQSAAKVTICDVQFSLRESYHREGTHPPLAEAIGGWNFWGTCGRPRATGLLNVPLCIRRRPDDSYTITRAPASGANSSEE